MYYYGYEAFKSDMAVLADQSRSFDAEVIVGIARGGLAPALALSHAHGIRNVQTLRTELYDDQKLRDQINIFGSLELEGIKRVLLVDDILDSGRTLQALLEDLSKKHPRVVFKTAVLFYKERALVEADFKVRHADEWIEFFWEKDFGES